MLRPWGVAWLRAAVLRAFEMEEFANMLEAYVDYR